MKICLIGQNLTNLILAYLFSEKKLYVDIYLNKKIQKVKTNKTIAFSSENFDYLKSLLKTHDLKKKLILIKKIKKFLI